MYLEFLPRSHDPAGHSCEGSGINRPGLVDCGTARRGVELRRLLRSPGQGDTMGTIYQHCYLDCPNHHSIPIPHSSLVEKIGNPVQNTTESLPIIVACPECGLVSAYLPDKMFGYLVAGTPSLFQAGECHLVAIRAHCDGENCKAPKIVHAIWSNDTGTWRPKVMPKDLQFQDSARCQNDHQLRLDASGPLLGSRLERLPSWVRSQPSPV
jgi:hypothetical protein